MKTRIGIAGREAEFLTGLMDYINRQGVLEVFVCTEEEYLDDELRQMEPEVLFREQGFGENTGFAGKQVILYTRRTGQDQGSAWKKQDECRESDIWEMQEAEKEPGQKVTRQKEPGQKEPGQKKTRQKEYQDECVEQGGCAGWIYMYQPVDELYEQMLSYIWKRNTTKKTKRRQETGIYAVYSPLGRSGKTSFALAFSKEYSFFYLGMEEYGTVGNKEHTVDEVLYHIRNRKEAIGKTLMEYSEMWQGIRMLASPLLFPDLKVLTMEDYHWFFDCLREEDDVGPLMIDMGTGSLMDYEIFDLFDRIYVPVLDGGLEQEKLILFQERIREFYGEPDERYRAVKIPLLDWREEGFLHLVEESDFRPDKLYLK